jgi:hypothetical protein
MFKVGDMVYVISNRRNGLFECSCHSNYWIKAVDPDPRYKNLYLVHDPRVSKTSERYASKWDMFKSLDDAMATCDHRNALIATAECSYPEGVKYE